MKQLIKNVSIIDMVHPEAYNGDIAVEGNRIRYVGNVPKQFLPDVVIDYHYSVVVMPGLIDSHTHMAMGLLRNIADDLPLMEWLQEKIWPLEAKLTPEDIYDGTLLGMTELIRSGSTTFRDMYFEMDQVAEATIKSGMRAVLGRGMVGFGDDSYEKIKDTERFHATYHGAGEGRIYCEVSPHAPYTCNDDYLKRSVALANQLNTTLHIHLSESVVEVETSYKEFGVSPVKRLEDLGLWSAKASAAHCVQMTDDDLDILAKHQVSVLYNPSSNLKLGNGFARIPDMIDRGINVALATDGASSNNNLNMMEEMHLAAMVNKGVAKDPTVMPAWTVLTMATVNGAKALGIDQLGQLRPDYLADMIFIDLNQPHLVPHGNLISAMVYSAQANDVQDVMIDGRYVMRNRQIETIDQQEVLNKCRAIATRLMEEPNEI